MFEKSSFTRIGLALLLCVLCSVPVRAQVTFHDDFDGSSLDLTKWTVGGGGTIIVAGGVSTQSAGCNEMFPFVQSATNPFPTTGDFVLRVGFQYTIPNIGGNGFGTTTGLAPGDINTGYGVWQDFCCGGLRALCGSVLVLISPPGDNSYHVYEWRNIANVSSLFVDGVLRATDSNTFRPVGLQFGHPPYNYCSWSTQAIDFVHVEGAQVTSAHASSWTRVKAFYR